MVKQLTLEELGSEIQQVGSQIVYNINTNNLRTDYLTDLIFTCTELTNQIYRLYKETNNQHLPVLKLYLDNIKVQIQRLVHNQDPDDVSIQERRITELRTNAVAMVSMVL